MAWWSQVDGRGECRALWGPLQCSWPAHRFRNWGQNQTENNSRAGRPFQEEHFWQRGDHMQRSRPRDCGRDLWKLVWGEAVRPPSGGGPQPGAKAATIGHHLQAEPKNVIQGLPSRVTCQRRLERKSALRCNWMGDKDRANSMWRVGNRTWNSSGAIRR